MIIIAIGFNDALEIAKGLECLNFNVINDIFFYSIKLVLDSFLFNGGLFGSKDSEYVNMFGR